MKNRLKNNWIRFFCLGFLFFCLEGVFSPRGVAAEPSLSSSNIEIGSSEVGSSAKPLRFDMGDLVRMAVRNNSEIRGADYDLEVSRWQLKEAQPRGIPVVEYQYETAPVPRDA